MGHPRHTTDEIAAPAKEIYEQLLCRKLESRNVGRFLVIVIETGEDEMVEDDLAASLRAHDKKPDGLRYGMRIGYRTSGTIGGKRPKRTA